MTVGLGADTRREQEDIGDDLLSSTKYFLSLSPPPASGSYKKPDTRDYTGGCSPQTY